jgi:lipopolysaccharide/colanic/teichoic acid biosynthesis glycosyltransferase
VFSTERRSKQGGAIEAESALHPRVSGELADGRGPDLGPGGGTDRGAVRGVVVEPESWRKRGFDVVVAFVMAVVTAPVLAVVAFGSLVAFRAQPFFTQERVGRGGRTFTCVKVRSLPVSAPPTADRRAIRSHEDGGWGSWLRRAKLDELPQLWLVVTGTMSLVGPRPVIPGHSERFDTEFVTQRLAVRPGLTGLWQISPHKDEAIDANPEFDLHYLAHRTLRLDVWIVARTARFVLGGRNDLRLDQIPRWTGACQPRSSSGHG